MNDDRSIRAIVDGVVQGVGFRYSTQRAAQQLGVVGWVRNRPDGSVEVLARGSQSAIDGIIEFLNVGPPHCHVSSVEITEISVDPGLNRFDITV